MSLGFVGNDSMVFAGKVSRKKLSGPFPLINNDRLDRERGFAPPTVQPIGAAVALRSNELKVPLTLHLSTR